MVVGLREEQIIADILQKWHRNPRQLKALRAKAEGTSQESDDGIEKGGEHQQQQLSEGEIAARCFARFDCGKGPIDAVKEL